MFSYLQRLAFDVQSALKAQHVSISRAQVHEALAALFGYGSVAAMRADPYTDELETCFALVLDRSLGEKRMVDLGLTPSTAKQVVIGIPTRLAALMKTANRRLRSTPEIHLSAADFVGAFAEYAETTVFESDEAASAMAETNAAFDDVDVEETEMLGVDFGDLASGDQFIVRANGLMSGDQIDEKMYTDNDLEFDIATTFEKVGKVGARHLHDDVSVNVAQSERVED